MKERLFIVLAAVTVAFMATQVAGVGEARAQCSGSGEVIGDDCAGITYEGCCEEGWAKWCEGGALCGINCGELNPECGWAGTFYDCGTDGSEDPSGLNPIDCVPCDPACEEGYYCTGGECVECSCDGKECGTDGCGNSCGECECGKDCTDGACVFTACDGKDCGDDGCGGTCGECLEGWICLAGGTCCEIMCEDKQCGPDGCGGDCGTCEEGNYCDGDGLCQVCSCEGKECGGDGCGNPCGTCADGKACDADGKCGEVDESCKTKDTPGCPGCACEACVCAMDAWCCETSWDSLCVQECEFDCDGPPCSQYCFPDCVGKNCGNDGCGGTCGECAEGTVCDPNGYKCWECSCEGKQCGEDECGNSCGECEGEASCNNGVCVPKGCAPLEGPGCGGCDCEDCVCAIDSYCCDTMWDSICAGICGDDCDGCPCAPDCLFKECGGDGCDGSCGECPEGQACDMAGLCCDPQCEGKDCGPDGCDGECGTCDEGFLCEEGVCTECIPDCEGKECGPDGCGGECGACPVDESCGPDGLCLGDYPEKCVGPSEPSASSCPVALTMEGCCDELGRVIWCDGGMLYCIDCAGLNPECGWDAAGSYYNCGTDGSEDPSGANPIDCAGAAECDPPCGEGFHCVFGECVACSCEGKQCGDDGCGNSCGECGEGFECNAGVCEAAGCGGITFEGCCDGQTLKYCENDEIKVIDCSGNEPPNDQCGWKAEAGFYDCGGDGEDPSGLNPIDCPAGPVDCDPPCEEGFECVDGECVPDCVPDCAFMECGGDDGCGGDCGVCDDGFFCNLFFVCEACTCDGKECGDGGEGCGLDCGDCSGGPRDLVCWQGACVEDCMPDCVDKDCGDGGCAGWDDFCGVCLGGAECIDDICVGCVPDCENKECGPDGCGDICGTCDAGQTCEDGVCKDICVPNCQGKDCGDDGCGDQCGTCDADETCDVNTWKCVPKCTPQCTGKECGDDGCGGTCPPGCGMGATCQAGACVPLTPPDKGADAITGDVINPDKSEDSGGSDCMAGSGSAALPFVMLLSGLGAAVLGRRRRE